MAGTNQSAVTKNSPAYKESKSEFNKNALAGDYQDKKPGWEKYGSKKAQGTKASSKQRTIIRRTREEKKAKDEYYKRGLGTDYEDQKVKKDNVKKPKRIKLKDFLKMNGVSSG